MAFFLPRRSAKLNTGVINKPSRSDSTHMQHLIEEIQKISLKKKIPELTPGMTVRVHQKIKEGDKERVQVFEGVIIAIGSGKGVDKNFTVRKLVDNIGVEKTFPFHSPIVTKVEIKKTGKVRRAKLYYMRNLQGKAARLKDKNLKLAGVTEKEKEKLIAELAEQKAKEEAEKAKTGAETGTEAEAGIGTIESNMPKPN